MIRVRPAADRGRTRLDWLDSRHTFSFADYYDPDHMAFRSLRVINDDVIAPGAGFPNHSHRDMEIVTYMVEGTLEHRDSLGTGSVIRAGEVQRMTAGVGVTHSEYNHSREAGVRLLQIWLLPERGGLTPSYEQKSFAKEDKHNRLRLIVSHDGREGSVGIHQDVSVYAAALDPGIAVAHALPRGRHAWVQVVQGRLRAGDGEIKTGDGVAISGEERIALHAEEASEVLLFDLA